MSAINDGYIYGTLHAGQCGWCGAAPATVVEVNSLSLPKGVTREATILSRPRTGGDINTLGVECGCYAKFHRQVCHIIHKIHV